MIAGTLEIQILANIARLSDDINKAKTVVGSGMRGIEDAVFSAKRAMGALGIGIGIGAVVSYTKELIGAAAALDDLSEKTGASVEALSMLDQVSRISGASLEGVSDIMVKMSRALAGADEESKGAGAALAAIGLKAEELRRLDPADALRTIAVALNEYKDSGSKAAVISDLLGKSAAQYLPFLKDLATETGIVSRVTTEQAAKAEELEKALRRLGIESRNTKQEFMLGLVPTMLNVIEQFNEGKRAAGGFLSAIMLLGTTNPFRDAGANLNSYREELEELQKDRARQLRAGPVDVSGLDTAIAATQKRIEFMKVLQRQEALEIPGGDTAGELARMAARLGKPTLDYVKATNDKEKKGSPYESAIKALEKEGIKVSDLTRRIEVLREIEAGHYGFLTVAQKDNLERLASIADATREQSQARKADVEALKQMRADAERYNKEAETLANKWRDLEDPLREHNRHLAEGLRLLNEQRITIQQFNAGAMDPQLRGLLDPKKTDFDLLNQALKEGDINLDSYKAALERLRGPMKDVANVGDEIFQKLSSGFESAVLEGKQFGDVLRGIGRDMLAIFVRKQITEPAGKWFSSIDWSKIFSGVAEPIATAAGGYRNANDLLLVGEQGPELWVPSSAGTMIPNHQLGRASSEPSNTTNNHFSVDMRGASLEAVARLEQYVASIDGSLEKRAVVAVANRSMRGGAGSSAIRGR